MSLMNRRTDARKAGRTHYDETFKTHLDARCCIMEVTEMFFTNFTSGLRLINVLDRGSIAENNNKIMTKKQVWEGSVYLANTLPYHCTLAKDVKSGTQAGQYPVGRT